RMKRFAPAKINLSLKVLGQRPDGFHDIETLMAPISIRDEVTAELSDAEGITLTCSDATLPTGDSNLAWKAAEHFFAAIGKTHNIRLHIEKHIPAGAGLGGGSSDAATVILLLNDLLGTKLPLEELERIAAKGGSDSAFFIRSQPAICMGRGEVMEPYTSAVDFPLLLIKPPFGVETAWAYKTWKDSKPLEGISYAPQKIEGVVFKNDLERPVFAKHIFLAALKTWLLAQPETRGALMSGSGSTVYAILRDASDADALTKKVKAEFGETMWIAATETRSGNL
ncbi:MAG: 4-(cytidine 5'-diphospho)-2-C-methyl-D-erythritol kinase, partial [Chthoniobacterales bacterium]